MSRRTLIGMAAALIVMVVSWPHLKAIMKRLPKAPALVSRQQTQTVLVRYTPDSLPLSIPPKTTDYILRLNPRLYDGLDEQFNERSDNLWWPQEPPRKTERPPDQIYICKFTNSGDQALWDVVTVFDLTFFSVAETRGEYKKNPNGTSSLSVTLPQSQIPGALNPGVDRMLFAQKRHGKVTVTAIAPGEIVSTQSHRVVIPVIPAKGSATIYIVNESNLFAHVSFPTTGNAVLTSNPHKQPLVLIRPEVNVLDKFPDFILAPSTYHWSAVPDA